MPPDRGQIGGPPRRRRSARSRADAGEESRDGPGDRTVRRIRVGGSGPADQGPAIAMRTSSSAKCARSTRFSVARSTAHRRSGNVRRWAAPQPRSAPNNIVSPRPCRVARPKQSPP